MSFGKNVLVLLLIAACCLCLFAGMSGTSHAYCSSCQAGGNAGVRGIGTPAIYNPHWAGGLRGTVLPNSGKGFGVLARFRDRLHPHSSTSSSNCAEASCGVGSCAASTPATEPSCGVRVENAKDVTSVHADWDRPPGEK